jgi:hypothetical protein
MDFCPAFWEFLRINIIDRGFIIIDSVYDEIRKGKDETAIWLKDFRKYVRNSDDTQEEYRRISNYINEHRQYEPAEKDKFMQHNNADPFIIATAMKIGGIVITQEVSAPKSKKIKIPDVCNHFGVEYANTYAMIRALNGVFTLQGHSASLFS